MAGSTGPGLWTSCSFAAAGAPANPDLLAARFRSSSIHRQLSRINGNQPRWNRGYRDGVCAGQPLETRTNRNRQNRLLHKLFWQEAERNRTAPLLGGMAVSFGMLPPMPTVTRYTFKGHVQNIHRSMVPHIPGRSYAIEAHI